MQIASNKSLTDQFDPRALAALEGLDFKARYVMEGFLSGLHESPFHGYSVEFSDYRNYQPGDDLRHLDWKLFARTDRLCIKRYLLETNVQFYVVCDTSASMAYRGSRAWETKLGCARIISAAMTWFLLNQNDAAGLIALDAKSETQFIRPSSRSTQFGLMLREMEKLQPAGGASLVNLLTQTARLVRRRSVILFFSDLLEPSAEVELYFKQLRFHGHECLVFQVLDPDEIDFPFTESHLFEDMETGARRQVSPANAREKYLERFGAFMEEHRKFFQSLEIPFCVIRNDENPWRALALFLSERKRMK
ncbi:MAG: DUF58 domain-containing protein [Verrucomicrobiota bacterium]